MGRPRWIAHMRMACEPRWLVFGKLEAGIRRELWTRADADTRDRWGNATDTAERSPLLGAARLEDNGNATLARNTIASASLGLVPLSFFVVCRQR